ncbi:M23 family metallopeptidase [Candidatus Endowatersipora endosymbiont of Watersipora subatra]|uniref:M23 family metallopeptidase n=1 Tax=Candidatus Endowatersipora endosymbiont of Watersipora subatra TaxID=3077946 RepID=UPI00312C72F5
MVSKNTIDISDIENEVTTGQTPFDLSNVQYDQANNITLLETELAVKNTLSSLKDFNTKHAVIPYFKEKAKQSLSLSPLKTKVVAENESRFTPINQSERNRFFYSEELITITQSQSLITSLSHLNLKSNILRRMASQLVRKMRKNNLEPGTQLRVALEHKKGSEKRIPHRITVYYLGNHQASIALNDAKEVVWAKEPSPINKQKNQSTERIVGKILNEDNLPSRYDSIYRAILSQGLNRNHAKTILHTITFDIDFRKKISILDKLEILYSLSGNKKEATDDSQILFFSVTFNGVKYKYYRFKVNGNDSPIFYDENGNSTNQFLLRKPVPNSKFNSPFGMRRHPISGVYKFHGGVDWSAPLGTPILAAGNGIVEKAGWSGSNGRLTVIRHANGYKTSYSHQHQIARGIVPGTHVSQGQIIGTVGSTGHSTGPHLHYEIKVNNSRVNPMKIRLPKENFLKGRLLNSFMKEKNQIDLLMKKKLLLK